ncbi:LOW QUALITY PROTEIN: condensin complex subunit 2-like [Babylonia areolata]|uniref:LOW QUALITY PROTEIN: condensin complex subunit 2-like n=1 Tax=Babylonia areolata TaxID=304850 RepID=UPI003FD0024B
MTSRGVLSPLTNTPISSRRPPVTKYVSPSTSRQAGLTSLVTPSASSLLTETHDDEKERRDRRRSRIMELQRNLGTSPGASPDRRGTPLNGLTSSQLAEHYTNCIQLSAENKINSKNAFGLHLIDYMAELLKKRELENFQVASSTLDASAKIYAGRVDFIHSETYKVLSGLGTGNKQEAQEDDAPADDGGEGEEENKKRKKTKSKIIRTNLKTINVNKFDLEFEVDPMFQVMSATFDEGGASGLLLNHLRCYDDKQLLVLDSSAVVPVVEEKEEEDGEGPTEKSTGSVDVGELRDLMEKMSLEEKQICPALSEFRLTGWDGTDTSCVFPKSASEFAFDPHGEIEPASVDDDVASLLGDLDPDDLQDVSDSEADGPDEGAGGDSLTHQLSGMKGDSQTAEFIHNAFNDLTQGNTGKLMQILASQPSDYSYFNKVIMRTWAGPAHWKTAPLSRDPTSLGSSAQKSKPKRPAFQLTYEKAGDLDSKFKASKATALTKATLQKYTKKKTTLPEDLHFQADNLFRLFHRHNIMIKRQDTGTIGIDDGIGTYDYDNANDRENYCPDLGGNDDDDDAPDMGFNFTDDSQGFSEASQSQMSQPVLPDNDNDFNVTSLTGDKLLSQPYKVAKIDISYAKTAKRVDVRKLKTAMWSLLTSSSTAADLPPPQGKEEEEDKMCGEWSFQTLLESLPSQVSAGMAKNLSVPIAFVCLLHLANEKTLKIFDKEMSDLSIDQDL